MTTIRFKFKRENRLRFISHLDQQRLFQRAFRRAAIPIAYSSGFNPHPKLSFALAMSVGMVSDGEYGDVVLAETMDLKVFLEKLNAALPEGIHVVEAQVLPPKAPSLTASLKSCTYRVQIKCAETINTQMINDVFSKFLSRFEIMTEKRNKKGKMVLKNIRPFIEELRLIEILDKKAIIEMKLNYIEQQCVKPEIVLSAVNEQKHCFEIDPTMVIRRTTMQI